jgi:hypothetical protein
LFEPSTRANSRYLCLNAKEEAEIKFYSLEKQGIVLTREMQFIAVNKAMREKKVTIEAMEEIAMLLCDIMHRLPHLGKERYSDLKDFVNINSYFSNSKVLRELGETLLEFKPVYEPENEHSSAVTMVLQMGKQRLYKEKLRANANFCDVCIKY